MMRPARTLSAPVIVRGVGIHTGAAGAVTIRPAAPGAGVSFRLAGGVVLPASAQRVTDTARCTVLGEDGAFVSTVEHLLSAFYGLNVTDADVEVDGPELPILDGSALPWVEAMQSAGLKDSAAAPAVSAPILDTPLVVTGRGGSFLAAYPAEALRLTVATSFEHPLAGTQVARFEPEHGGDYAREVAPARTFGFIEEVEALRAAGLAQGGSFENALVIYPDHYSSPLRFPGELAYHKLLDVLGDLFLAFGGPLPFPVDLVANKPSHRLNVELANRLHGAAISLR